MSYLISGPISTVRKCARCENVEPEKENMWKQKESESVCVCVRERERERERERHMEKSSIMRISIL